MPRLFRTGSRAQPQRHTGGRKGSDFMELRTLAVAVCTWIALAAPASAIPSSITYQGSLKQQGLPATGTKIMLFRITNSDGSQVYWSSGNLVVTVNNGLFSARITPT